MQYLNLGCGFRFHPAWTNIDFASVSEGVDAYNLAQGIPFSDSFFEAVYHSHLLEHFSKSKAVEFIQECYRVLQPQGILRIVVPDLEQITRAYLTALENASAGSQDWAAHYEWILLEMFDQTVRNSSGGEMAAYLFSEHIRNEDFVLNRFGLEAKTLIDAGRQQRNRQHLPVSENHFKRLLTKAYRVLRYPAYRREVSLKKLLGDEYATLQIGRFRQSGEVHQWMYDQYSLSKLLKDCGFKEIVQRSATESYIPNWPGFNLDTEVDGTVYKPDSLFIEAIKPAP